MIRINLGGERKKFQLPTLFGVELSVLNLKMIIIGLTILFLPDFFLSDQWESEIREVEATIESLKADYDKLKESIKGHEFYLEKINAYKNQVEILQGRETHVAKMIATRINPHQLLLHITKSTPQDIWLDGIEVLGSKLVLSGGARSYKSIGLFIASLNQSIFFDNGVVLKNSTTIEDFEDKKRVESFEINAPIARFE